MRYRSTSNPSHAVSFAEAVTQGIAVDGGLYLPEKIPALPKKFFEELRGASFQDVSKSVAFALMGGDIPEDALSTIVRDSITFDAPLRFLEERTSVLELFHGPTLAFKDFGARFMARTLAYLHTGGHDKVTVLVATSGDTGSAVAHGFVGVDGVRVVLLYPSGRISRTQELQMTTLGGNVSALEIDGAFDDCQRLVKEAFADQDLISHLTLTSANSINVARLLPQTFYYVNAYAQLPPGAPLACFSVPSGNLGNLTAGLIAWKMGLPVGGFIAGTNRNDTLTRYLTTGVYRPMKAVPTLSNAMDVGSPSNLVRITALFGGDLEAMRRAVRAESFTDRETVETIEEVYARSEYVLDPHGAIAYRAAEHLRSQHDLEGVAVVLATAHPAKFMHVYSQERLRNAIEVPERLRILSSGEKHSIRLPARANEIKEFLLNL